MHSRLLCSLKLLYTSLFYGWIIFDLAIPHCSTFWLLLFFHCIYHKAKPCVGVFLNMHAFISQWKKVLISTVIHIAKLPSKIALISISNLCCMNLFHHVNTWCYWCWKCLPPRWEKTWYSVIEICIPSYILVIFSPLQFYIYILLLWAATLILWQPGFSQAIPPGGCRRSHFSSNNPRPAQWLEHNQ